MQHINNELVGTQEVTVSNLHLKISFEPPAKTVKNDNLYALCVLDDVVLQ